jgi:hypothetical protein
MARFCSKAVPYMHCHCIGCSVHIRNSETQQPKAGPDQAVFCRVRGGCA